MRKQALEDENTELKKLLPEAMLDKLNASIQMSFAGIAPDGCRMVRPRGFARQPLRVAANALLLFGPGAIH